MISKDEVIHIAKLARLELTEEEIEKMQKDLSSILDYFDLLKKADTSKLKTLSHSIPHGKTRLDLVLEENNNLAGDLIKAAPNEKDGYIKVKQVL